MPAASALLQKILDALPDPVWLKDREGRYLAVNRAAGQWIGAAPEAILGRTDYDFFDRAMADRFLLTDREAATASEPWSREGWMTYPDGRRRYFETVKTPILGEGDAVGVLGVSHDVTERKQAENALRESGKMFRDTFEQAAVGFAHVAVDGRFLRVNRKLCEIVGYSREELLGFSFQDITHPDDLEQGVTLGRRMLAGEIETFSTEKRYLHKDGHPVWALLTVSLVRNALCEPDYLISVIQEIEQRKKAEETLRRYQEHLEELVTLRTAELKEAEGKARQALVEATRLARLRSDFIANMSHEIRTPLNAMLGQAQVGIRENRDSKNREHFARIEEAGHILLAIINDILDFSKIEAGKLSVERIPFPLGEAIDRAISLTAGRAYAGGLDLTVEESPELPEACEGDPVRLAQVLINLLSNAIKFTERGRVALIVRRCAEGDAEAPCIAFRVEDTGIGMTGEEVARLFRPFEQADTSTTRFFGGTGLGLVISRRLADLMGGAIHVESQPGAGSTFELRLPLTECSVPAPLKPEEASCHGVRLVGLPLAETAALSADLRRRGIAVAEAEAARAFDSPLPYAVVMDVETALDTAVLDAERSADPALHLVLVVTPGDYLELPEVLLERAIAVERPLNFRRLYQACQRRTDGPGTHSSFGDGRRLSGLSVLAAEDNLLNQVVLADILDHEGATLTLASNGRECLDRLRERGADAFDILLTDIQMPEMDGYETARQVRAIAPSLPIVGLTAHAMPEERQRCLDAGMDDHMAKPFDIDTLVALILRHAAPRPARHDAVAAPASAIDWPALEARYSDRPGFVRQIAVVARASIDDAAVRLREAASRGDHGTIAFLAHRLKGTAGHLMARRLLELSGQTEAAAKGKSEETGTLAERLADAVDAADCELLEYDAS